MSVPAAVPNKLPPQDHKLTLDFVLPAMVRTGLIEQKVADNINRQEKETVDYALSIVAKFGVKDRRPPHLPLTLDKLMEWLAHLSGKMYFEIDPLAIDIKQVGSVLPFAYLKRLQIIPVKVEKELVWFATSEPYDLSWVSEVQSTIGKKVGVAVASPLKIRHFIDEFFTVRKATQDFKRETPTRAADFRQTHELDKMIGKAKANELGKNASAVIRIVDWLFQFAHDERATDIHMEPRMGEGVIRFRIDGRMRVVYKFDPEMMLPLVSRMKILADMQVDEKRKPQDGRIRYKLPNNKEMEMRVSTIPVQYGEKLVIRIFDPKMAGKDFEDLGFAPEDIEKWRSLVDLPHGLVLVTGPTGSGKSTTLHTSMRQIATEDVNVCTIEDPIEIVNDDLNQMQVNSKLDLTFGEAIRSFLRQDPDIIMVGEIRDNDAGHMAVQAALTGHLVLSTLHTNDAVSSISRLLDLQVPSHLISAALRGMMAQRLVRRLCDFCKEKVPTPLEGWNDLVGDYGIKPPAFVFAPPPNGCRECKHTGYMGRLCVYEIVLMDDALKAAIRRTVTLDELNEAAAGKFTPLCVNGASKVAEGVTSLEEVLRVIF